MLRRFKSQVLFLVLAMASLAATDAFSSDVEVSLGFNFNRSNYGDAGYTWNRRWGGSFGLQVTDFSQIEFQIQDVVDRTKINGYEDTEFHDRVYSTNWVQQFTTREFPIQPYVKVGVGQLNRDAFGNYASGTGPNPQTDSVTGVMGAGLRIYFTRAFALRVEGTSYLTGANIRTWKDNFGFTTGLSWRL